MCVCLFMCLFIYVLIVMADGASLRRVAADSKL